MNGDAFLIAAVLLTHAIVLWLARSKRDQVYKCTDRVDRMLISLCYALAVGLSAFVTLACLSENAGSLVVLDRGVLRPAEAAAVVATAEAEAARRGGWTTARHQWYPTTDLKVYDIVEPLVLSDGNSVNFGVWWNTTMEGGIFDTLSARYAVPRSSLVMKDLFVVKYSLDGQTYLPEHQDSSQLTFNIALSEAGKDFTAGGSMFAIAGEGALVQTTGSIGDMLTHEGGLFHAGRPISSGTRYILIGFVAVEYCSAVWYRMFGSLASCAAFQQGQGQGQGQEAGTVTETETEIEIEMEAGTERRSAAAVYCRPWLWLLWHVLRRPLLATYHLAIPDGTAHDSAGGGATSASPDVAFSVLLIVLFLLIVLVLFLLCCICCAEDKVVQRWGNRVGLLVEPPDDKFL
jgi:hypothetical protein